MGGLHVSALADLQYISNNMFFSLETIAYKWHIHVYSINIIVQIMLFQTLIRGGRGGWARVEAPMKVQRLPPASFGGRFCGEAFSPKIEVRLGWIIWDP